MKHQLVLDFCFQVSILLLCDFKTITAKPSQKDDLRESMEEKATLFQEELFTTQAYYTDLHNQLNKSDFCSVLSKDLEPVQLDYNNLEEQFSQHLQFLKKVESIMKTPTEFSPILHDNATTQRDYSPIKAPVGFSASLSAEMRPVCYGSYCTNPNSNIVLYDSVDVNLGNVYDKRTGRFTAPFPGVYSFVVRSKCRMPRNFDECTILLFKNGYSYKSLGIDSDDADNEIRSLMELKEEETVFVKLTKGTLGAEAFDKSTVFKGYRLV